MRLLEERILADGAALSDSILKVDSFLNHQVDPGLMQEMGREFARLFADAGITRVVTIESSGIAPAVFTALTLGVPLVTLKKQASRILSTDLLTTEIHSFTKATDYQLTLSKRYISDDDRVLIIDDFLANGEAAMGAARLVEQGGAQVTGIGIVIEKSFQSGRGRILDAGYDLRSLARVSRLAPGVIEFTDAD